MKTLKILSSSALTAVAALLMTMSCTKEPVGNLNPTSPVVETVTLRLSAPETKTTLQDDKTVLWTEGDKVAINHVLYDVTVNPDDCSSAIVENVPRADEYYAVYAPQYNNFSSGISLTEKSNCYELSTGRYFVYFSTNVVYAKNSFPTFSSPMCAYSTDENLSFYNLGGVVKIGLTGNGEMLNAVMLNTNSGSKITGYESVLEKRMQSGYYWNNWSASRVVEFWLPQDHINVRCTGQDVVLGSEPTWFYFPVAPFMDPSGIYVTALTEDGGIFAKVKNGEFSVNRSQINELSPIEYRRFADITLEPADKQAKALVWNIKAEPNSSVRYAVAAKSVWDDLINSGVSESRVPARILALGATSVSLNENGVATVKITRSNNSDKTQSDIQPETEYVVIAQYGYAGGKGTCFTASCMTPAASGEAPALTASVLEDLTTIDRIYTNIKTNASGLKVCALTTDDYNTLADGMSDTEIADAKGTELAAKYVDYANTEAGLNWYIENLYSNTEYAILILATSDGGMQAVSRLVGRTLPDPETTKSMTIEDFSKTTSEW